MDDDESRDTDDHSRRVQRLSEELRVNGQAEELPVGGCPDGHQENHRAGGQDQDDLQFDFLSPRWVSDQT